MNIFKSKKEKTVDEILMTISNEKFVTKTKTLTEFSNRFQPEVNKVISVLKSSKNDEHIKVSQNMFNLMKRKWNDVIDTNQTILTLVKEEEKRFIETIGEVKERISREHRKVIPLLTN